MTILSVRRASINLGEIPLNVYRITKQDGKTKDILAGRSITDAIGQHNTSLKEKFKVNSLKDLPHADLSLDEIKADTGEKVTPVAVEDAALYWGIMSQKGNSKATALLVAMAIESIQSRVNKAFGETESKTDAQGWTTQGMNLVNAIASLWEAANKKPEIKSNIKIKEVEGKTGIVFVQEGKHAIGIKEGISEEPITGVINVAAWI